MARKYKQQGAQRKVKKVMEERKSGTLKSRSGKKVKSRKQVAIAIGLSEARRAGKKVPKKKKRSTRRPLLEQTKGYEFMKPTWCGQLAIQSVRLNSRTQTDRFEKLLQAAGTYSENKKNSHSPLRQ